MYRAGIVGCGRIGCAFDDDPRRGYVSTHAGAYANTPGVELAALCDIDSERLRRYSEKFAVPARYGDVCEMLRQERLDIVSVCTRAGDHRDVVEAAAQAGVKAVFCEKPLAGNLADADAMVRVCRDAGVLLMVDYQRRFDRFHQQLAAYVRDGRLGRVQQVTSYYAAGVANNGTHLFDYLRFLFGDVAWVQGSFSENPSGNDEDPNLDGMLKFQNGVTACVQAVDVKAFALFETVIAGTKGRLSLRRFGFALDYEEARPSAQFAEYNELQPAAVPLDASGTREYMLQAVAHLLECLRTGRRPLCSGEDGRAAMEIMCTLLESAKEGGRRVQLARTQREAAIHSR